MAQPIDYLGMMQRPNIGESLLGGLKTGLGIRQMQDEQAAREQARQQQEQYRTDLQQYINNPTASGAAAMTAKYPDQAKAFKQSFDLFSEGQKDSLFRAGTQAYSAIQNGNVDAALKVFDEQIEAMKNSGQDTSDFESLRDQVKQNPQAANSAIGLSLASIDPDKWSKIATEQRAAEQAPFELSEKQSKAAKSAVDAKFAESKAVQDLQKGGWEIQKLANDIDISRQNAQIAALNANINRETNDLKRQELQVKLQEKQDKRDEAVRLKADEAQTNADTINTISAQIGDILSDEDTLRAATGLAAIRGAIPGTEARTMAGKIQQLQDIIASSNLDKLKGPMTDKDLEFIARLGANLDRYQDEDKFIEELKRLNNILPGSMDKLNAKYGSSFTLRKNQQAVEENTGAPPAGAVRRVR